MNVIVGVGAVGTVLAAYLQPSSLPLALRTRQGSEHSYAGKPIELSFAAGGEPKTLPPLPIFNSDPDELNHAPIERVIIACKHQDLAAVITDLQQWLHSSTTLLPALNGLCHLPTLSKAFPNNRIVPLTIMYNARKTGVLQAQLTTSPLVYIDGDDDELLSTLNASGMIAKQGSLAIARGKLLLNLNNAIGALTNSTFRDVMLSKPHRKLALAVFEEAMSVFQTANLEVDVPVPVPWWLQRFTMTYTPALAWQIAKRRNQLTDQSYPSMHADIVAGRVTEVREINGEIVRLAEQNQQSSPLNRRLVELVAEHEAKADTPNGLDASRSMPEFMTIENLKRALTAY